MVFGYGQSYRCKRRSAIEAVIGHHLKSDHRMGRNYLKGELGDKINSLLAGTSFNIMLLVRELADNFLSMLFEVLFPPYFRKNFTGELHSKLHFAEH